jgi:outer membrane immunogenic protein
MRKCVYVVLVIMVLALAVPAKAQDDAPKVEAFVGYSLLHVRVEPGNGTTYGFNFNGGSGQLAYNFTHMFSFVGDFGGYECNCTSHGVTVDTNAYTYLFGPRVSFRPSGARFVPFGQVLFGGARLANGIVSGTSENAFALAVGGGVDFNVTRHIAIRPVQLEYLMTKFNDGNNDRQNNFRYSAGFVFQF